MGDDVNVERAGFCMKPADIPFPGFPLSLSQFARGEVAEIERRLEPYQIELMGFGKPFHHRQMFIAFFEALQLPAGRYYVYGTGQLTLQVLPALKRKTGVVIAGFIDRNATAMDHFLGLEVILPEAVASHDYDYVLPIHLVDEVAMADRVRHAGAESARILQVQGHPDYKAFVAARMQADAKMNIKGRIDVCIVSTLAIQWSVVPNATLAQIFEPDHTVHFFYGNPGHSETFDNDIFPSADCSRNTQLLIDLIARANPKVIYLRTSPHAHSEALLVLLMRKFPDTTIINELNDWSALFSDDFLLRGPLNYSVAEMEVARFANYYACQYAGMVLCKSGGAKWATLSELFARPCQTYFPNLPTVATSPALVTARGTDRSIRMLFAGSIGAEERIDQPDLTQGGNFLRYLEILARAPGLTLDVFNSAHFDLSADAKFAYLRARLEKVGALYHSLTPFADIARRAGEWDYGLAASHYAEDRVENVTRTGLGNKFVGYISAGLPVVIDNRYEFAQSLVTEFDAGIVIDPRDLPALPDILRAADFRRHREGAQQLRSYMINHNRHVLNQLGALVATVLHNVPGRSKMDE